jgi:hypothetical protein
MHFQLRYITTDFDFGDAQISITDDAKKMSFLLRKRLPEDVPPPIDPGDGVAIVTCHREVPDTLSTDAASGQQVTTSTKAVAEAYQDMLDHMVRMLRLVRWRANSAGKPNQLRMLPDLSWSFDGVQWQPVQRIATSFKIGFGSVPTRWTPEAEEFVKKESSGGLDEPLGHELLREAWVNRGQNPRSSLVLAIAAAEVGFKQFASKTSSDGGWVLSKNFLSAHLLKMLTKFPWPALKLQVNGKVPAIPDSITSKLEEGVRLRNLIVHEGVEKLEGETVNSVLTSVRDLLYFLDALRTRQSWPINYMTQEARKEFV